MTKSNFGGTQKYVYDLATNLPKSDYDVTVVFGGHGQLEKKLHEKNIRTISIKHLGRDIGFIKDILVFFSFLSLFKKEKPDVVHLNSSKSGGIGALAARITRVPNIIFTAHGWHFKEKRATVFLFITYVLSWITVFLTHTTIVVSKDDYKRALTFPFLKLRLTTIHNGITPPTFLSRDDARRTLQQRLAIPEHSFATKTVVLSIGELTANKGYKYAIPAFEALSNHMYVIIGDGEDHVKLNNLINQYRLHDRVFLAGNIPDAATLLNAANIVLMPSLKEGLPYTLLEAGHAGANVIATNVGGIPEIITHNESGILIRPSNIRDITNALNTTNQFGEKLKQHVAARFSFDDMLQKTKALY